MKVLDYNIIHETDIDKLKSMVRHWVGLGWEPLGNLRVASIVTRDVQGPEVHYFQVIVRREQDYSRHLEHVPFTPIPEDTTSGSPISQR